MIQCQNPVEWVVDWPLAWLLTYSGSDCGLWRIVLERCMESELCRRVIEMIPTIGYSLEKHKCYDSLDAEIVEADQAPKPTTTTTKANHPKCLKFLKTRATQLPRATQKTKPLSWVLPPFLNPPHLGGPPQTVGLGPLAMGD